ncbi:serine/threonine-protein kinase [Nocardia sp. alder85J]|uniref:serine/threonine-protein kinase n=1 Tax=Nocardia sp. alder85J TaxID=2862949 RepID=UPI001CD2D519|nr:serine/threonine-protein kinase [Nocardia sp. alder85J]MCX4090912.1 serine/threonine-protein kinase [Nocardia sp. alder85J]
MAADSAPERAYDFVARDLTPAPGTRSPRVLAGRYRLDALLGSGGMGDVWRATDLLLHQTVAVKQVRIPPEADDEAAKLLYERTLREARAAARLRSHPSIVTIHDVVVEDGIPWIVMEFVDGRSLDRIVADQGPLPVPMVASIGLALLDGLSAAHAGAVLHRDVKPANVLVCHDGRVVLTDFGIATMAGERALTRTDMITGSPGYVAPERLDGEKGQAASDLWSLGATLYYAVEGRPPYQRDEMLAVLVATISADPDPMRLAGPLTPLLTGLLHRDPHQRMTDPRAREFLQSFTAGSPPPPIHPMPPRIHPTPAPSHPAHPRSRRTTAVTVLAVAAVAILLLAGAAVALIQTRHHNTAAPTPSTPGAPPPTGNTSAPGPLIMADPEACSMFTDDAAGTILGATVHSQFQTHSACQWSTPDGGTYASVTLIRLVNLTQAQDTFTMEKQDMRDEPRRYPGTTLRTDTTVGDESFAYTKPASDSPLHPTMVLFRTRNMLATIYVSASAPDYELADQFAAAVARNLDHLS